MDKSQKFELFGFAAVVLSLLFVAYEINQSNRIAKGTTSYELSRNWMEINRFIITEPRILDLRMKWQNKGFMPENAEELEVSMAFARMLVNLWTTIEEAHENGLASDGYLQIAKDDVKSMLNDRPGLVPIFESLLSNYELAGYDVLEPIRERIDQGSN